MADHNLQLADVQQLTQRLIAQVEPDATDAFRQLVALTQRQPDNAAGWLGAGIGFALRGQLADAETHIERCLKVDGKLAVAWSNLANVQKMQGQHGKALKSYKLAIQLDPTLAEAHYNLAVLLNTQGQRKPAMEAVERALLFRAGYAEARQLKGLLLLADSKVEEAVSQFKQALVFKPALQGARFELILALYRLGRQAEAESEVQRVLDEDPDNLQVLRVQAAGLAMSGQMGRAASVTRSLLKATPDAADLQFNLGEILLSEGDHAGALAHYQKLLGHPGIAPADVIGAMGNVSLAQGDFSAAKASYQDALMLQHQHPGLSSKLGASMIRCGDVRLGVDLLRRVTELVPESAAERSHLIHSLHLLPPKSARSLIDEACAKWEAQHCHPIKRTDTGYRRADEKPRVGFVLSGSDHSIQLNALHTLLAMPPMRELDLFVYQGSVPSQFAERIRKQHLEQHHVQEWHLTASLGKADVQTMISRDGLHLLIDMTGFGLGTRLEAMATRPAALQWQWLVECQGTDLPFLDGTLYVDEAIKLPAPFVWTAPPGMPEPTSPPHGAITFGAIGGLDRFNSELLDAWADVLKGTPGSRLVAWTDIAPNDHASIGRLAKWLLLRDIEPERITAVPRCSDADRWHGMADLNVMLDTSPNSHVSYMMEALWLGIPVVTRQVGRPWNPLLSQAMQTIGHANWVTGTWSEYAECATRLSAADTALQTASNRCMLRDNLRKSVLMDDTAFARGFTDLILRSVQTETQKKS